ncbi:MAG: CRISPR-associated protein Cas5 [Bacillales bacterium]|nr:CRISPR-associated protein Cas5 [Bacillales bacterium]
MRVLSFHICGKIAHFRKFYTNSTALSFTVPPRTTIIGIIAALLGFHRNSYYELFSFDQSNIAVAINAPLKKTIQKLNLLHVESKNDLNGSKGFPSQTPTEIILPQNIRTDLIDYKIWFTHVDTSVYDTLKNLLDQEPNLYGTKGIPISLGTANFTAFICYEGEYDGITIDKTVTAQISSIIPIEYTVGISPPDDNHPIRLIQEDLPIEFDKDRHITKRGKKNFIINLIPGPVIAKVKRYTELSNGENIMWMS